jgi:hypothetical protein
VTAVEVPGRNAGDSPQFGPLVETTAQNFVMNEVSADKAYSSAKNLQLVLVKQAMPGRRADHGAAAFSFLSLNCWADCLIVGQNRIIRQSPQHG